MRVLIDQNLPPRLVAAVSRWSWVASAEHVSDRGWGSTDDFAIWKAAAAEGSLILTKDKDFAVLSASLGYPPKVALLRFGNCSVDDLLSEAERHQPSLRSFVADTGKGLIVLDRLA